MTMTRCSDHGTRGLHSRLISPLAAFWIQATLLLGPSIVTTRPKQRWLGRRFCGVTLIAFGKDALQDRLMGGAAHITSTAATSYSRHVDSRVPMVKRLEPPTNI